MNGHKIKQGECLDSVAAQHGLFWETIWNDPENSELKRTRQDPFVLLPGDEVFVPDKQHKEIDGATESKHRFRRKGVPSKFRVQICVAGEPIANEPFVAMVDGRKIEGKTDADGWVEFPISPYAAGGELWIGQESNPEPEATDGEASELKPDVGEEAGDREQIVHLELEFGHLDPITETTGIQQRLENIGYLVGEDGVLDEDTIRAIAEFQELVELDPTGKLDDVTREKLRDFHGS